MILLCCLSGCSLVSPKARTAQKVRLYDKELSAAYDQTRLKKGLTLDVLPRMENRPGEILSQSESVVASLGRGKEGYKTWFTMVTFHEFELSVIRKYFFIVDEKVEKTMAKGRGFRFDCQMLLTQDEIGEILDTTTEAKQTAVFKAMLDNLDKDVDQLAPDIDTPGQENKSLDISVLLIKNVCGSILRDLERSSVLATQISSSEGIEFEHINFGKGRIRIWSEGGDTALIRIRLGDLLPTFDELPPDAAAN
jgi:hypothetical protein